MQSCVHSFFFFAHPTDPPSGRAMGNETFYGDGLNGEKDIFKSLLHYTFTHYFKRQGYK